jgi:XTP/dITP diphosphohydrolase
LHFVLWYVSLVVMSEKREILISTGNPGKIAEIGAMLDAEVRWLSLADLPPMAEIEEDGTTFAENARKKAAGYAKKTGLWTLADDSGLVVDALGGAPGVKSARFSGEAVPALRPAGILPAVKKQGQDALATNADRTLIDHRNIAKTLELLKEVPKKKRTARFVCRLCLASPEQILIETGGILEGLITDREIGRNGFGYDPIFFVPHLNKTVAQLTGEEKNAISHRGNAIRKLKPLLRELLHKT